ncbi:MAG: IS200/IS605 family transposase, partial [Treponemataceae bacterium]|nr:IS200/IS605 family transposase [Treponemataceae bacterium]
KYECKYHVVFIPKYRKKKLYGQIRQELERELRRLAEQKESRVLEGHMMTDYVHMLMEIPPKHSVPPSACVQACLSRGLNSRMSPAPTECSAFPHVKCLPPRSIKPMT